MSGIRRRVISHIWLKAILGLLLFFELLWCLRHIVLSISYPYPLEYGEGVTANWVQRLSSGLSLYPFPDGSFPWLHNPYPPLFYLLSLPFHGLSGNVFLSIRLISLFSLLAAVFFIYRILRLKLAYGEALICAMVFACSPLVWRYGCMGRVDMCGLAFSLCSLWLTMLETKLEASSRSGWIRLFFAGLTAGIALLIKPLFLPALLAGAWYVFFVRRRERTIFCFGVLLALLLMFLWLYSSDGLGSAFAHLGYLNWTGYSFSTLLSLCGRVFGRHVFLFALLLYFLFMRYSWSGSLKVFILTAFLLLLTAGKNGADEHYFLFSVAGTVLLAGEIPGDLTTPRLKRFFMYCLIAQLALFIPLAPQAVFTATYAQEIPAGQSALTPGTSDLEMGRLLSDEIRGADGIIISDEPGYLLVAGKTIMVQPFQFGRLAMLGRWDIEPLTDGVIAGDYGMIILRNSQIPGADSYFPEEFVNAVVDEYSLSREIGPFRIYLPRR